MDSFGIHVEIGPRFMPNRLGTQRAVTGKVLWPAGNSRQFALRKIAAALAVLFVARASASSILPMKKQNRLQRAMFCRRRCSLALMISLMSPAGRISQMVPNASAGCCAMSWTA
jgi:hypothetical protein